MAAGRNSVEEEDEADLVLGFIFGAVAAGVRDLESMRLGVDDLLLQLAAGLGVSCKVALDAQGDCALEDCALEDCALEHCAAWKIVLWTIVLWTIVCMEISLGISLGKSAVAAVSQAVAAWEGTLLHP